MQLTGWLFTDVKNNLNCPKCGSKAGQFCKTPKGRQAEPHKERVALATPEIKNASKRIIRQEVVSNN